MVVEVAVSSIWLKISEITQRPATIGNTGECTVQDFDLFFQLSQKSLLQSCR
jgi:hypothetical protein